MNAEEEFSRAIAEAGIPQPAKVIGDGSIHRFPTNGKASDKAGYYLLHADADPVGIFGDHRTAITGVWTGNSRESMSPEQLRQHYARIEELKRARAEERRRMREESAERANAIWDLAEDASAEHPYLVRKGVPPAGLRVDIVDGPVMVPMRDVDGRLRNLERIWPDGTKRGLPGAERSGLFFAFGDWAGDDRLVIAEGFSTASSLHQATGLAVVAAFDCGNLPKVAAKIRERRRDATILICADDDWRTKGNPGRAKAEQAGREIKAEVAFPEFGPDRQEGETDFNDMYLRHGADAVHTLVMDAIKEEWPPGDASLIASPAEMAAAQLTPRCFVEGYLYATVGQFIGQGGTGKTTLILYEAICLALGRDVWGFRTLGPGRTLIITKEDERMQILARMREIMAAMDLVPEQADIVRRSVLVLDVTGSGRKLLMVRDRNIERTVIAERLAERYRKSGFAQVIFDPAVSFGASESLVNDNEQGLIEVGRYLVAELGCAVRYVHHVSQGVARSGTQDQYAGRGGTAFADGSRMIAVVKPYDEEKSDERPPYGCHPDAESSLVILARPKMSYARANLPRVWIRRTGFGFEHFQEIRQSPEEEIESGSRQLLMFLESRMKKDPPEYYNMEELERCTKATGMRRQTIRESLARLDARGDIVRQERPGQEDVPKGKRRLFICPAGSCGVMTYPQPA